MSKFVSFDPKKHQGKQLYEMVSVKLGEDSVGTTYQKTSMPFEDAAKIPWYFVVEE